MVISFGVGFTWPNLVLYTHCLAPKSTFLSSLHQVTEALTLYPAARQQEKKDVESVLQREKQVVQLMTKLAHFKPGLETILSHRQFVYVEDMLHITLPRTNGIPYTWKIPLKNVADTAFLQELSGQIVFIAGLLAIDLNGQKVWVTKEVAEAMSFFPEEDEEEMSSELSEGEKIQEALLGWLDLSELEEGENPGYYLDLLKDSEFKVYRGEDRIDYALRALLENNGEMTNRIGWASFSSNYSERYAQGEDGTNSDGFVYEFDVRKLTQRSEAAYTLYLPEFLYIDYDTVSDSEKTPRDFFHGPAFYLQDLTLDCKVRLVESLLNNHHSYLHRGTKQYEKALAVLGLREDPETHEFAEVKPETATVLYNRLSNEFILSKRVRSDSIQKGLSRAVKDAPKVPYQKPLAQQSVDEIQSLVRTSA